MKSASKKLTGLLFILLACTPLLFFVITEIKQQAIQHKMKQQLETKMLQVVVVAENNIQWIKKGKEILINGRMFDIKYIYKGSHGLIVFSGLYDDDETMLVNEVQKKQQREKKTGNKLLSYLFQLLQVIPGNPTEEFSKLSIPSNNNFPEFEQRLSTQSIAILTPPPQILFLYL